MRLGDKNTTFFQNFASQCRQSNYIISLRKSDGMEIRDEKEMGRIVKTSFQELFITKGISVAEHILLGVGKCISNEANLMLIAKYTKEEIRVALKRMDPTKALGDNGFSTLFFQQY